MKNRPFYSYDRWRELIQSPEQVIVPPPMSELSADYGWDTFKKLTIPDMIGQPSFGEVSKPWLRSFVRYVFGAYDLKSGEMRIKEFFLLIGKKNSKSTLAAGIMLTALIINPRREAELIILAPTKEVADNSFRPLSAMIRCNPELSGLFRVREHMREIMHLVSGSSLKVVSADTSSVSGKKASVILLDELWKISQLPSAHSIIAEAVGGLASRPEGYVIYLTTQSDDIPAGPFHEKLSYARKIRDGEIRDPNFCPVLYEIPREYLSDGTYMEHLREPNPNLGASVSEDFLISAKRQAVAAGGQHLAIFLAKHLNIEMGSGASASEWFVGEVWPSLVDSSLGIHEVIKRSSDIVIGIDGGGGYDLMSLVVLGRTEGNIWLVWTHSWLRKVGFEAQKNIQTILKKFSDEGLLTLVEGKRKIKDEIMDPETAANLGKEFDDIKEISILVSNSGKLRYIGVDALMTPGLVSVLSDAVSPDLIVGVSQGWKITPALKALEYRVDNGTILHRGDALLSWAISNAVITRRGNSFAVSKELSRRKIDPVMALLDAAMAMLNVPAGPVGEVQVV